MCQIVKKGIKRHLYSLLDVNPTYDAGLLLDFGGDTQPETDSRINWF